ncbi:hypothetical protein [Fodinicola feengrottensis]|uniref:hypothetical protein n=1 Tax=Fodinicola feengrottensis TaxID=435914 RepID=UPI0031DD9503
MWRWRHGPARERQVVEAFAVFAEDPSGGGYEERLLGALRRATVPAGGPDPEFRRQLRSQLTALAAAPVRRRYPRIAMMAVAVAVAMLGTAAVTIDRDGASAFALQRQAEAAELALAPLTPRAAAQLHLSLASSGLRALRASTAQGAVDGQAIADELAGVDDSTRAAARILAAAALARGDRAPLDIIDAFTAGQLAALAGLDLALPAGQAGAVRRSESLLRRIAARSHQLRHSVACAYGYAGPSGSDDLGAQPPSCAAGGPVVAADR